MVEKFKFVAPLTLTGALLLAGGTTSLVANAETAATYDSKAAISFIPDTDPTDPVDPENPDPTDPVGPIDPTDPEGPGPGTDGPLSIDYASSLQFGEQKITTKDMTYYAQAQKFSDKSDGPNYVQVTDKRGTEAGWALSVTQDKQFTTKDGKELTGAQLTFSSGVTNTVSESPSPSNTTPEFSLTPENSQLVMSAQENEGAGTHVFAWGNKDNADQTISLKVPGKSTKYATEYETDLTWTLEDTPTA